MQTRKEMQTALKAKGIKFGANTKDENLAKLLSQSEEQPPAEPASSPEEPQDLPVANPSPSEPTSQLVEILTSLTQEINNLKADWQDFQKAYPRNTEVLSIGAKQVLNTTEIKQENGSTFLTQVPVDLLKAAKDILGEKFSFECNACTDRPAFMFTVIVPKEYSSSEAEDRRSRVIDNALGANGVRDWCSLVKQNVIKTLGVKINF